MRTGAANDLKTVGGCLKDLDHLSCSNLTNSTKIGSTWQIPLHPPICGYSSRCLVLIEEQNKRNCKDHEKQFLHCILLLNNNPSTLP